MLKGGNMGRIDVWFQLQLEESAKHHQVSTDFFADHGPRTALGHV